MQAVFPDEQHTGREQVRLAIRRVQDMIDAATQGDWPPHHIR
jgi:hypothetical protein